MEKVSVVIPVYGQWNLVERNINQLLRYEGENIKEIIVVDDCSRDKNPYIFDDSIVMIIRNPENLGYTATVNKGLRMATSDIILLLDSDACPIESFIKSVTFPA